MKMGTVKIFCIFAVKFPQQIVKDKALFRRAFLEKPTNKDAHKILFVIISSKTSARISFGDYNFSSSLAEVG
uniref:Uncharacterized protein n=1 Tax=Romanomermis culicivorax TaxID=13658 RepID=A0A915KVK8_ROMCU